MNQKLEEMLIRKYSELFRLKELITYDKSFLPICFGIEVGDGWFKLLDDLFSKLSKHVVQLTQVKEKFGLLRIYINGGSDGVYKLISEAERKSGHICETCGKPGKLREWHNWWYTSCLKHRRKNDK